MDQRRRFQLLYFAYFAAYSGFATFRNVYLEELGMTGFQMGLIGALYIAGGVAVQPLWGAVADWTRAPARILLVATLGSGVASLSYPLGAAVPATFAVIVVGTLLFSATRAPIVPLSNSLILQRGYEYGEVRSFGSIAFGIGALVVGFLLTGHDVPAALDAVAPVADVLLAGHDVSLVVYIYAGGMALVALVAVGLPREEVPLSGDLGTAALELVRGRGFALLLAIGFLMGLISSSGASFFSVYMREVGLGDGLTGVAWALKTVAEALVFLQLGRFRGNVRTYLAAAAGLYAITYGVLGLTSNLALVIGVELLLGAGYALFYYSLVTAVSVVAPETLQSTAQTLLTGLGISAGGAVGQVIAGRLVDVGGVQFMYRYLVVGAVAIAILSRFLDANGDAATAGAAAET